MKTVSPTTTATAFSCPNCGALATQYWQDVWLDAVSAKSRTPTFPGPESKASLLEDNTIDSKVRDSLVAWIDKMLAKVPFTEKHEKGRWLNRSLNNVFVSECFNCDQVAIWVHQTPIFPPSRTGDAPSDDMPSDIARDFEEARAILSQSPRGAAALLRLCIQKLCIFLGEKGKNIDQDIASLVSKGLNPLVQKSLDVVRVIGNESVHPGSIDLRDDRETASQLLRLVNLIVDQMITLPNSINLLYNDLPEAKRKAIDERNQKVMK